MKKYSSFLIVFLLSIILGGQTSLAEEQVYQAAAEHAIVIEVETGKILYEKNAHSPVSVASISQLLTAYLVYEAIEEGKLTMDSPVAISDFPYKLTLNTEISNVLLESREYTVEQLLRASLIVSANSATIALAEKVAGSEKAFVDLMREKVQSWGIGDATIVNATGLNNSYLGDERYPGTGKEDENKFSAAAIALIARRLVLDYPQVLDITSQQSLTMDGHTYYGGHGMLEGKPYQRAGVDGLKTGYSATAGASLVTTADQQNMRVLTVILNADHSDIDPDYRYIATTNLLNYVVQHFQSITYLGQGQAFDDSSIEIFNGRIDTSPVVAQRDFRIPIKRSPVELPTASFKSVESPLDAPLKKGTAAGRLWLHDSDLIGKGYIQEQPSLEMVIEKEVKADIWPVSWWNYFVRYVNEKL